jgi:DNA polymerase I-like protein with 3'-5' exonuclease and polymerase domains
MQLVTLDFETYYDVGFSLSGLTTEEYIKDPRFQVIGVGVKIDDGESRWITGTHNAIKQELDQINWKESVLLCHNTQFDGGILSFIFNIIPAIYLDTLSMARAVHGVDVGGSLAFLVEKYNLGRKGTEVIDAKGKRLEDFNTVDLAQYGSYCKNDVDLTYKLFQVLAPEFPENEIKLIDLTLRMYTEPVLEVDDALLQARLEEVQAEKSELLKGLMTRLECDTEECVRGKLASNKQFAEILQELGITVPLKISPATGKDTYALAKGDQGFLDLCEHEDPYIQELCRVRLGTKSTIEESRIERFIGIGARNKGKLPIPLKYYGAHTGRWAGSDKVNFQNLPARDKKKKALKNAIIAPEGHQVINSDSSQIEARVLVWLAGQNDVVKWYEEGRDVYSEFATKVYNKPITKADKTERAVGKTCILGLGYGTGWSKLKQTLKLSAGADLDDRECQRLVKVYRDVK